MLKRLLLTTEGCLAVNGEASEKELIRSPKDRRDVKEIKKIILRRGMIIEY